MYKIEITKMVENPNYESELEAWRKWSNRSVYDHDREPKQPQKYIEESSLITTLTDEEFKAVKKAALDQM